MNDDLKLQSCVVRITAQNIEINWLQPYKNDDSKTSVGSGFFIEKDGYILTCSHLVLDSKKIFFEIPFEGREKYEAKLVYVCPDYDIALLKSINYKPKRVLQLVNENKMYSINSGEEVYAIGFPLGQNNLKISKGVISGRQKGLIQTSAPLNPGNSGGPLLYKNKVIGINISKVTFASNVGYAAPISHYYVIDGYRKKEKQLVIRPNIGFEYVYTNSSYFKYKNIKKCNGVLLTHVFKNSPAWNCGIRKGDILCKINGINIDKNGLIDRRWFNEKMTLLDLFNTFKIGDSINIEHISDNKLKKSKLVMCEYQPKISNKYPLLEKIKYEVFGGIIVAELNLNNLETILNNNLSKLLIVNRLTKLAGALVSKNREESLCFVTHVFSNSIVKNDEVVKEGDIISQVNNKKIKTIENYRNALKKSGEFIVFKINDTKEYIIDTKSILENELDFSKTFQFPISKSYKNLSKKLSTKKKLSRKKSS